VNTTDNIQDDSYLESASGVLAIEAQALITLKNKLDQRFVDACKLLLGCEGRIVVTGIGKSGHIGNKIAATFASTGSPAFFLHAAEASHGDLGMLKPMLCLRFLILDRQTNYLPFCRASNDSLSH
jgi:arabinose-5-phosphate isomerase